MPDVPSPPRHLPTAPTSTVGHGGPAASRPAGRRWSAVLIAVALLSLATVAPAATAAAGPTGHRGDGTRVVPSLEVEPFLFLHPSPTVVVPDGWSATAVIQGTDAMRGTLTLTLHPVGDTACAQTPLASRSWNVVGPTYWLPTLAVDNTTTPGTYYWKAAYSGDPVHAAVSVCRPQLVVARTTPRHHPFASWAALVARQYGDVLGRPPTATETAYWVAQLSGRTTVTPGSLVADLRGSADNRANVDPAVRLYRAYFLRDPDQSGLAHWVAQRRRGASLSSISSFFAASSEFQNRYGALSDRQFVELVYRNVLGREGEPAGVAFWTSQLSTHRRTRGQVMIGYSESSEFGRQQAGPVDVAVLYLFLLGRLPSGDERAYALLARAEGRLDTRRLADDILDRPAYAARVTGLHPGAVPTAPVAQP